MWKIVELQRRSVLYIYILMWDHIINIYPSELLSTKTKEFRISE